MAEVPKTSKPRRGSNGGSRSVSEDKWVTAYRQNSAKSLLLSRLPEEILLNIMTFLPNLDLYLLRHASRVFMRLFEDKRFDHFRSNEFAHYHIKDIWSRPNLDDGLTEKEQDKLANKLWNSGTLYCKRCVKFRDKEQDYRLAEMRSREWHCQGCGEAHPTPLFSATQRHLPDSMRRCIGREGVVKICDHMSLSWKDVELWFDMELDSEVTEEDARVVCRHESHNPLISAQSRFTSPISLDPEYITGMMPTLLVQQGVGDWRHVDTVFKIRWSTLVAEIGQEQHVTFQRLSDGLKRFGGVSTNYLCPHVSFDDVQLLLPFDPNRCACLGTDIPIQHLHDQEFTSEDSGLKKGCCLCYAAENGTTGRFLPADGPSHITECQFCDTYFMWKRVGRYIILEGLKEINTLDPVEMAWLGQLDPNSYSLTKDKLARYISWCPDKTCSTTRCWAKQFRELEHYSDPMCCGDSCSHGPVLRTGGFGDPDDLCQPS